MVEFHTAYSPMDRKYSYIMEMGEIARTKPETGLDGISISNIATDINIGKDILSELKAKIYAGVSKVEIGFSAAGKGWRTQGQVTPEAYGKEEREAIKELAKINEIKLSTHATVGVGSYSGMSEHGFSQEQRQKALFELKRAIEFAADVAGGGPVVCHVGEWHRSISEPEKGKFEAFPDEAKKAKMMVVNIETGQVQAIGRDTKIPVPVIEGYDKDNNPIYAIDPKTKMLKSEMKTIAEIIEEERKKNPDTKLSDEEIALKHFYSQQIDAINFNVGRWNKSLIENKEKLEKLNKALEFYQKIEDAVSEEERNSLKRSFEHDFGGLIPPDIQTPAEFLKKRKEMLEMEIKYEQDAVLNYSKNLTEIQDNLKKMKPIHDYGLQQTAESLADAALYARKVEQKKNLERPIQICPEEIFPETFGGHPDELKEIVQASRKRFAEKLVQMEGVSKEEAEKIAREKIGATFDTGHMNTWRKYFKGSEKEFKDWVISKAEDLAKHGIITHVHVTDNFGYYDEHLAPGQGDAPLKEILDVFKKYKIPEKGTLVVESQGTTAEWQEAISGISSPIYKAAPPWHESKLYRARASKPYFVTYGYVPIEEHKPWTETPFE